MKHSLLIYLALHFAAFVFAQTDFSLKENFEKHIEILAHDSLQGRNTGTIGEEKARKYIIEQYKEIGLRPMGQYPEYLQPFEFTFKKIYRGENSLKLNNTNLLLTKEFYPVNASGNGKSEGELIYVRYGIEADDLGYSDYSQLKDIKKRIFVMETGIPDNNPHSRFANYISLHEKIKTAAEMGAAGVIFINSFDTAEIPAEDLDSKMSPNKIPAVFLKNTDSSVVNKFKKARIAVSLEPEKRTGHNVIGFIDNHKTSTVVLGAHYDHLGFGDHGSLYRGAPAIHNGADDNASGVAMILELARYLKTLDLNSNVMILAFSGEELGLYGSNFFVKTDLLKTLDIKYMINLDMVGRLDTSDILIVNGTGTSKEWEEIFDKVDKIGLELKTSESGVGPSDHTSFYLQDIPVLHFFTGTHEDYHKPSDDPEKINYQGMESIFSLISNIVIAADSFPTMTFQKTKDQDNANAPKFTVTLGVIPDYLFNGSGMRIDGVTEDRPAAKAGLKKGDIVVRLGDIQILDMMTYMKALSSFRKGDKTTVTVKRGEEELSFPLQF